MIYLDYAATTPCDPAVIEAMLPFFGTHFANASSVDHAMGTQARRAIETARGEVAELVGAREEDIIFTSGSTESNNLCLSSRRFLIASSVEHPSVLEPVTNRSDSEIIPVDSTGAVAAETLRVALADRQDVLVSIMHTNNETGVQNDIVCLSNIAHERGALFHSDVTQSLLTSAIDFRKWQLDAISISAHKVYGPKGVGAAIVRSPLLREIRPLVLGGGHERGVRSGTFNVPGIVGFGAAASLARKKRERLLGEFSAKRATFLKELHGEMRSAVHVNGAEGLISPHILSLRISGVNNRALLRLVGKDLCFSLGSACATNKNQPSHVLLAMGLDAGACNESFRVSFGAGTTEAEIASAARLIANSSKSLLEMVA